LLGGAAGAAVTLGAGPDSGSGFAIAEAAGLGSLTRAVGGSVLTSPGASPALRADVGSGRGPGCCALHAVSEAPTTTTA